MSHEICTPSTLTKLFEERDAQLATQSQEIARLRERVGKLREALACDDPRFGPPGKPTYEECGTCSACVVLAEDDRAAGEGV